MKWIKWIGLTITVAASICGFVLPDMSYKALVLVTSCFNLGISICIGAAFVELSNRKNETSKEIKISVGIFLLMETALGVLFAFFWEYMMMKYDIFETYTFRTFLIGICIGGVLVELYSDKVDAVSRFCFPRLLKASLVIGLTIITVAIISLFA